jgi:hypothetical protein
VDLDADGAAKDPKRSGCGSSSLVVLAFGDGLELDTAQFELRRAGRPVPMEPQAFDVLT